MATPARELSYGAVEIYNEEVLGIGSYGKVCKAKCGQLPCAAKLLHDTMFDTTESTGIQLFVKGFEQECQFLKIIKHPSIVQYLGTTTDPQTQRLALLMELMDESLTKFLDRSTAPLPYYIQLNLCHDIALALAYLHSNGIIHRDLSSNNILLIGEGVRAKVTDFGMSKLIDMNPRMTPLTQCPGTAAYMPPEALITPPQYSSKLDCFSHGVLTIQIITRKFPDPKDAQTAVEDTRFPTGRVVVFVPEKKRRKKDIDGVEPDHPLLPLALHCLEDRDKERPSADELCEKLISLKKKSAYGTSVEQTTRAGEFEKMRAKHEEELNSCREKYERELSSRQSAMDRVMSDCHVALEAKTRHCEKRLDASRVVIAQLREENRELSDKLKQLKLLKGPRARSVSIEPFEQVPSNPVQLTWKKKKPAPETMASFWGSSVVHGNSAYFSWGYKLYSYSLTDNKWTDLTSCQYQYFSLAVVSKKLVTVGGCDGGTVTNHLLSLSGILTELQWEESLPPMPTARVWTAVVTTPTHLVVAGGAKTQLLLSETSDNVLSVVEALDLHTFQWSSVASTPEPLLYPNITLDENSVYLSENSTIFSCSVEELLKSCSSRKDDGGSVWTRLTDVPTPYEASLATLKGHILAVGGSDHYGGKPSGAIYAYHKGTNSWSVTGTLPTPRSLTLNVVLPSHALVVVGGRESRRGNISTCKITEVAYH